MYCDPEPVIHLKSFDSMNATYIVRVHCMSKDYWEVYYTIVENVRASCEEHFIEMGTEMFGMRSPEQGGGSGGSAQQTGGADSSNGGAGGNRGGAGNNRGGAGNNRGSAGSSRGK